MFVTVTDRDVQLTDKTGPVCSIAWDELQAFEVRTNDLGPVADDVFLVLTGSRGRCEISNSAAGADQLVARLARFPGFRSEAFSQAMSSTENAVFVCWQCAPK